MKKQRADVYLTEKGYFDSREKAKRAIMAGIVYSGQERIDKPGTLMTPQQPIMVKDQGIGYVGRGGLKMKKALQVFPVSVAGRVVLDIGASTGGFTDCCLQNGAQMVYALDVGYNQLAWKLRKDERVVVMERTNFRYVKPESFPQTTPTFVVIDVSFISLRHIFPALAAILAQRGEGVALVKPQFEAGRNDVLKNGIVRDSRIHKQVISTVITFMQKFGFSPQGLSFSPVTGGSGNVEFLLYFWYADAAPGVDESHIEQVIAEAHTAF